MSELRIIKEWKPEARLVVPDEIKAMYPDGEFSFVNPNHPGFVTKVSSASGQELVKITDPKLKAKYGMYIETGTNFYRIGDALLSVQHKETKKAKDKYIEDIVSRKLPKSVKEDKDSFNKNNALAKKGFVKTDATIVIERGNEKQTISV